jgi:gamma-glutamyltranspeptidase/glutathione hydrolase
MLASPHALATAAGVDVLRRGGNAVDAAIAANAVLAVVYPASCGLGGDALWLVYEPKTRELSAYNGSGRAPAGLCAADLRDRGMRAMPVRGALTVTVPGCVRGWEDVARAHGTRGLDELLAPAEAYARDGFVATDTNAAYFAGNEALLRSDAEATDIFLQRGAPRAGEVVGNAPLADSLRAVRERGAAALYEGPIGAAICATLNALGNPMSLADLAAHSTERVLPLRVAWHGLDICAHPPNSGGALAPMVLGALRADGGEADPQWTHLAVEAFKAAFDVRDSTFADPDWMAEPVDRMLRPAALAELRARIDPLRARPRKGMTAGGGTIAIVAVDGEGRAVSLIESIYMSFGSGIVARGTGIFLHNRGAYFSLEPGHPNELAPGKRPLHTLSPGMILRDGRPALVYGTMGGDGQPQTQVQIAHNVFERGMSVQAAIDAPRFVYGRDSESAFADKVTVESRLPSDIVAHLRARGHEVEIAGPYDNRLGHAHAIQIDAERGTLAGGADPRADSLALGL